MIVVMKNGTPELEIKKIMKELGKNGFQVNEIKGVNYTILGLIGDTVSIDPRDISVNVHVEKVIRIEEPYKQANRIFHPENSIIDVAGIKVGGEKLAIIAGPCSIETKDQMNEVAMEVKKSGASMLRGGAFKPRTSPYSFQGLKEEGLDMLVEAGKNNGLPVVTELMSIEKIPLFEEKVDLIQVGARNMQNFELLKAIGRGTTKPILLKRGLSATIEEWIMSAEYIIASGNPNVILCERGIRTFENYTRNTLDLSAVLAVKKLTHLPVIVDPSHAAGKWWMVEGLAKAAIAVGADGLMIEVHNDPKNAWCDGAQSLKPKRFNKLMEELRKIAKIVGRSMD
ncbi:3-deoxy-7-phosphoheptulonate synthase [Fusobacterium sp. IOR10]|uniref:3-deoxy-7-phosphoheptulonate synthase n=1 Tax=Fusobacterium sp. IOR10 TaxID=2665157 RepID=UPI0013D5BECE|nr:3-deoxy-7-phosphoheptulonate synthase [Fusobacterium sp. IOR10]